MIRNTLSFMLIPLVLLGVGGAIAEEPNFNVFIGLDAGRIEKGTDAGNEKIPIPVEQAPLGRSYFNLSITQQLDEKNRISFGVGGLFFKPYLKGKDSKGDKTMKFGPGISHATMDMNFLENLDLTFGYMGYKYNQSAKNLGEYLFRTEAYPTIIRTGGWSWLDAAVHKALGAKLSHSLGDGFFTQDFLLFMEMHSNPLYDVTPAYVARFNIDHYLTLGGAFSLHRFYQPTEKTKEAVRRPIEYVKDIPLVAQPYTTEYKVENSSNSNIGNLQITLNYMPGQVPNLDSVKVDLFNRYSSEFAEDGVVAPEQILLSDGLVRTPGAVEGQLFSGTVGDLQELYGLTYNDPMRYQVQSLSFNSAATKLVAFFDLDFRQMLGYSAKEFPEFKVYGEMALLGLKNYPIFYTKYSERLVSMAGVSIPLKIGDFTLLEKLSVEMEYLKNPNADNISSYSNALDLTPSPPVIDDRYRNNREDDVKWSVYALKKLNQRFSMVIQVANDHYRPIDLFTLPTFVPITNNNNHWYWITRFQWTI